MTDRELLELAAKAAGITVLPHLQDANVVALRVFGGYWAPLTDDGDALRLAVRLEQQLDLRHSTNEVRVFGAPSGRIDESVRGDPCAATRRAIVRAAAEMAKA